MPAVRPIIMPRNPTAVCWRCLRSERMRTTFSETMRPISPASPPAAMPSVNMAVNFWMMFAARR